MKKIFLSLLIVTAILVSGIAVNGASKSINTSLMHNMRSVSHGGDIHKHHDSEINTTLEKQREEAAKKKRFDGYSVISLGHTMVYIDQDMKKKLSISFEVKSGSEGEKVVMPLVASLRRMVVNDGWFEIAPSKETSYRLVSSQSVDVVQVEGDKVRIDIYKNSDEDELVRTVIGKADPTDKVAIEICGFLFGQAA